MIELASILLHDTIALITILNPLAAAGIMISMIAGVTPAVVRPIAKKAALTVFIASLITLYSGELVFKFFGINVLSLKVIGGIFLLTIALNMASGHSSKTRQTAEEKDEATDKDDVSVVPLGIPILFGPGVIATIIVLNHNLSQDFTTMTSYGVITVSIFFSSIIVYMTLRYASAINGALGITGMKILTRIMGLIVGAIAVQFIIGGVKGLWV